jgi:hypothetical protein
MTLIKELRARVSDVAGFALFVAFSATFLFRMPEMSVLLVPAIGRELFTAMSHSILMRAD